MTPAAQGHAAGVFCSAAGKKLFRCAMETSRKRAGFAGEEVSLMNSVADTPIALTKAKLRQRIIDHFMRAERIVTIASASPQARAHTMMIAYEKVCEQFRAEIALAEKLFPDTDSLVDWLLDGLGDDVMSESDRTEMILSVRTLKSEIDRSKRAS
jgi:hypothetical protein